MTLKSGFGLCILKEQELDNVCIFRWLKKDENVMYNLFSFIWAFTT